MPIDPNIALSVKPVELQNPLTGYTNFLNARNLQEQNALHQFQFQQAQEAAAREDALRNALAAAGNDPGQIGNALIRSGDVGKYTAFQKGNHEAQKAASEAFTAAMVKRRDALSFIDPNSPDFAQQAMDWHMGNHADPYVGPVLSSSGITPGAAKASILQAAAGTPEDRAAWLARSSMSAASFAEKNAPKYMEVDQNGRRIVTANPGLGIGAPRTVGTYDQVPLPTDVFDQQLRLKTAGATRITNDMRAEGKYEEGVAEGGAKSDTALYELAKTAPIEIGKLNDTLKVLKTQDINTGIGAEAFTALDALRSQFLKDTAAGVRTENTQYLNSLLGSSVFGQLQAMGLASRNIDTPAERDFLRNVISGTITLNKDTLIRMAEMRKAQIAAGMDEYNKRVDNGDMDKFFRARQRKPEKFRAPKDTSTPATIPPVRTEVSPPAAPAAKSGGWKDL